MDLIIIIVAKSNVRQVYNVGHLHNSVGMSFRKCVKGIPIQNSDDYYSNFQNASSPEFEYPEDIELPHIETNTPVKNEPEIRPEKKEKLLKHYNEDEKRSIESIKKMLLKSKK